MTQANLQNKKTKKRSHFNILEANTIFLVLAGVFLTLGAYVQSRDVLSGLLITEYGIIVMPILIYSLLTKKNLRDVFRLHKLPIKSGFKIIIVAVLLLPIIVVANLITLLIIEMFSNSIVGDIPTATTQGEYLVLMFIISITAGICEETFFRGMILDAYETKLGRRWGAVFSGLLFGIFHYNPQNLLGPIILGIVFAYLVQVTGSILAGMIAHATNNGIAVSMGYIFNQFTYDAGMNSVSIGSLSVEEILMVMMFYGFLALLTIVGLRAMLKSISKDHPDFALGNGIQINRDDYKIVANDGNYLYVKPLDPLEGQTSMDQNKIHQGEFDKSENEDLTANIKRVNIKILKNHDFTLYNPFWPKRPFHLSTTEIIPLVLTLIMYAFIIYYAYF